jgi:hypothetical protein
MSRLLSIWPISPIIEPVEQRMHFQIIMDYTGDTRHEFDASDELAVALAEKRFQELTGSGFRAAALGENGAPGRLIGKFDPEVERTLFIPHLKGG